MKRIAPEVEIIDITHGIQPQGVLQGALVLANTLPYMPEGVHLAVVDPGVGRRSPARSPCARRTGVSSSGPTTACSCPAAEKLGGIEAAHELTNREYALEPVSRDLPRPRRLRAGGRAPRAGARPRRARPGARARLARAARGAEAGRQRAAHPRTLPLRRPVREHAAEPDASRPRAPRHRAGNAGRARARVRALLRDRRAHVRRRARRRDHPLRGRVREHRDRDQRRAAPPRRSPRTRAADVRITLAAADARGPGPQVRAVHDEPGRPPAAAVAALPQADRAPQFDRIAPAWDDDAEPTTRSRRSRRRSTRSTSQPAARARSRHRHRPRGLPARARAFPTRRSSAPTWPRTMIAEARRLTPPELEDRVRFEVADAEQLPYPDGSFDLVSAREHDPVLRRARPCHGSGRSVVFSFSGGPQTPIYVRPAVLTSELEQRGFCGFCGFCSRRRDCAGGEEVLEGVNSDSPGRRRHGDTGPDVLFCAARQKAERCARSHMATRAPGCNCRGEVAQLVEHTAENRGVAGSIPALATSARML